MKLLAVLTKKRRVRLPFASPLILFTVPPLAGLFLAVDKMFENVDADSTNWRLHPVCAFLGRAPVVFTLAGIWFLVDVALLIWANRAHRRGGEAARPARLFFTWQAAKFAFFLLYFAILFAYRPFEPWFDLHPCHW